MGRTAIVLLGWTCLVFIFLVTAYIQYSLLFMFALAVVLLTLGAALRPLGPTRFEIKIESPRVVADHSSHSEHVIRLTDSFVRLTGSPLLAHFEIRLKGWSVLAATLVISLAGLGLIAQSDALMGHLIDQGSYTYLRLFVLMYIYLVPLGVSFVWINERFLLKRPQIFLGWVEARGKWAISYAFIGEDGDTCGGTATLHSSNCDDAIIVFAMDSGISKPHNGLRFHSVKLMSVEPLP